MALVDRIRGIVTTALDTLALLLFAAGVAVALWPVSGGLALCAASAVVATGSAAATRESRP